MANSYIFVCIFRHLSGWRITTRDLGIVLSGQLNNTRFCYSFSFSLSLSPCLSLSAFLCAICLPICAAKGCLKIDLSTDGMKKRQNPQKSRISERTDKRTYNRTEEGREGKSWCHIDNANDAQRFMQIEQAPNAAEIETRKCDLVVPTGCCSLGWVFTVLYLIQ